MTISNELLDELLKGCKQPEDPLGDAGLMKSPLLIKQLCLSASNIICSSFISWLTLALTFVRYIRDFFINILLS